MRSAVSALSLACACLVIQGGDAFTLTRCAYRSYSHVPSFEKSDLCLICYTSFNITNMHITDSSNRAVTEQ